MKWKKYASLLLAGCMAFSAVPAMADDSIEETEESLAIEAVVEENGETEVVAEEIVDAVSGSCGKNLTWKLDDAGTLTIKGSGDMGTVNGDAWTSRAQAPWNDYRTRIKKIVMADTVTSICNYTFINCTNLETVEMSAGMKTIGSSAFENCSALTSIEIPSGVTSIGLRAFNGCKALKTVSFNAVNCKDTGWAVCTFSNAGESVSNATLTFGSGVKRIPQAMFCASDFKIVSIASSVESIGQRAFYQCAELKTVTGGSGLKTIEAGAFSSCGALTAITIPSGVTTIGEQAFSCCYKLAEINYNAVKCSDYVVKYNHYPFEACGKSVSGGIKLTVGTGVTRIPANMFGGYKGSLTNNIPANITSVSLPVTLKTIGENAFKEATGIKEIIIPERVQTIGATAFIGCTNLSKIYFRGNAPSISSNAFSGLDADAYYPKNNSTWTSSKRAQYGAYELRWNTWSPQNVSLLGVEDIFTDISAGQWYVPYIQYVYDNGLMSGVSDTTFQPNNPLTRAMIAQILYSAEGKPSVSGTSKFSDVKKSDWFYNAVVWASTTGVVSGYADGTFKPYTNVTREQLAVMLYAHAGKPTVSGKLTSYTDYKSVSSWATDAMKWAVKEGIISGVVSGSKTYLQPQGNATRAQTAVMLMKYIG